MGLRDSTALFAWARRAASQRDEWGSLRASAATTALQLKPCRSRRQARGAGYSGAKHEGQGEVSSRWTSSDRLPPLAQRQTHGGLRSLQFFFSPFLFFLFFHWLVWHSAKPQDGPCNQASRFSGFSVRVGKLHTHPKASPPPLFLAEDAFFFLSLSGKRREEPEVEDMAHSW